MYVFIHVSVKVHLGRLDQKKGEIKGGGKRNQSEVKPEQHWMGL